MAQSGIAALAHLPNDGCVWLRQCCSAGRTSIPLFAILAFSVVRILPLIGFCLISAACVSQPDIYAPPAQRKPLDQDVLIRSKLVVDMAEPLVDRAIVSDIRGAEKNVPWRWTGQRPTVSIKLKSASYLKYFIDFSLVDATFKETGPVSITYYVNDQVLDKVTYDSPGRKTFEKLIPAGMLKPMSQNTLAAEIDKTKLTEDGSKLGFILVQIGLRP